MSLFLRRSILGKRFTPISCAYPLNADSAEIIAGGFDARLTMSTDEQTGSYLTQSGLLDFYRATMSVTGAYDDTVASFIDMTSASSKKVVELQILSAPPLTGGTGSYRIEFSMLPDIITTSYGIRLTAESDGTFTLQTTGGLTGGLIASGLTEAPSSLAYVFDSSTGQHYIRYNSVNYSVQSVASSVVAAMHPTVTVREDAGIDAADAGLNVQVRFETFSEGFIGDLESGTIDTCGNTWVNPLFTLTNDAGIANGRQEATITGNSFSYITPASVPVNNKIGIDVGFTNNLPMWSDKRAIEFEITRFDTGNLTYTGVLDPAFFPNAYSSIFVGDAEWTFYGDDVATVASPVVGSGIQVVGIVIDGTTGDAEFYLDGSLVSTSTTTLNTSTGAMFTLYWDGTGAVTGEGIEGSVRTLGSEYTYSYGVGVKDFQGNTI